MPPMPCLAIPRFQLPTLAQALSWKPISANPQPCWRGIGPPGTQFSQPVTLVLSWQDANNDGIVDGTTQHEANLFVSKDGVAITGVCSVDPGCEHGYQI